MFVEHVNRIQAPDFHIYILVGSMKFQANVKFREKKTEKERI